MRQFNHLKMNNTLSIIEIINNTRDGIIIFSLKTKGNATIGGGGGGGGGGVILVPDVGQSAY